MFKWSIPVSGTPTSIIAKQVEWNGSAWEEVDGGNTAAFIEGSALAGDSGLKWYHANIEYTGNYTAFWNGTTPIEGYEGFRVNNDATDPNISAMMTHITKTNNPHNVTKAQIGLTNVNNMSKEELLNFIKTNFSKNDIGLENVENKSSADIRDEINEANIMPVLYPDLADVTVTLNIINTAYGFNVKINTSSPVYIQKYLIEVKRGETVLFTITSQSDSINISEKLGFSENDALSIRATIYSGSSSSKSSEWTSHTYVNTAEAITLQNIVNLLKADLSEDETFKQDLASYMSSIT